MKHFLPLLWACSFAGLGAYLVDALPFYYSIPALVVLCVPCWLFLNKKEV